MRRARFWILVVVAFGVTSPLLAGHHERDAKGLVARVVEEAGGADALHRKKDVEYTYLYRRGDTGTVDLSLERYVFDGEKSWARYDVHEMVAPKTQGPVVQGFDGKRAWQTDDGALQTNPKVTRRADFLRKTNFYWFAMTFKLLDPGLSYTYEGQRKVGDALYEIVRITFGPDVGDVADTYVLYINPKTWRIDQFLFTVLDYGKKDPFLMEVDYDVVDGVLLPVRRRYAAADWSGTLKQGAKWIDEVSVGIRFDNGFKSAMFEPPR